MAEEIKPSISKFLSWKITGRKLNGDNILQWKQVLLGELRISARGMIPLIQRRRLGDKMIYFF